MENKIIMSMDLLDDIVTRLAGCQALLHALVSLASVCAISEDAIGGVSDLLEMIRRDFQADIDCTGYESTLDRAEAKRS